MTGGSPNVLRKNIIDIGDGEELEIIEIIGASQGLTVSVIGGVHGDEEEGILSVRRFVQLLKARPLKGIVRCIAVANPAAYRAQNRLNPIDGKNLAREFPGLIDGSITERTAHAITKEVITGADAMIDLHSAGINYAMPLFCGFFKIGTSYSHECAKIAYAFGSPIVWAHTKKSEGRSISTALELGVPAIYAECGGGGEVRSIDTNVYVDGLINILHSFGMLDGDVVGHAKRTLITDDGGNTDQAIKAPVSGVIVTYVATNDLVRKGDLICDIYNQEGQVNTTIKAPIDGIVMLLRRTAHIKKDEIITMIAPEGELWSL